MPARCKARPRCLFPTSWLYACPRKFSVLRSGLSGQCIAVSRNVLSPSDACLDDRCMVDCKHARRLDVSGFVDTEKHKLLATACQANNLRTQHTEIFEQQVVNRRSCLLIGLGTGTKDVCVSVRTIRWVEEVPGEPVECSYSLPRAISITRGKNPRLDLPCDSNISLPRTQLNIYGFHKTRHDEHFVEFKHPNFRRGQRHLVGLIRRKPQSHTSAKHQKHEENVRTLFSQDRGGVDAVLISYSTTSVGEL